MRTFAWWFGMGSLTTLSVLMVQGGVRDLIQHTSSTGTFEELMSMGLTILGGGLLAGSIAVILNRLR